MTSINDFLDENNRVNWGAYRQAQRDAGESCNRCDGFIAHPNGNTTVCYNCRTLDSREKMPDSQYVRCPKCSHEFNVWDNTDYYMLWDAGHHPVICTECDTEFDIETRVTFTFISPAMTGHDA